MAGTDKHSDTPAGEIPPGYEVLDTNPAAVFKVGLVLVVITVVTMFGVWYFVAWLDSLRGDPKATVPALQRDMDRALPPGPRLQVNPAAEMATFHAQEQAILDSYGWVNEDEGVVRVPISVAMDMVLEKGLPTEVVATSASMPAITNRQENWDSSGGQAGRR